MMTSFPPPRLGLYDSIMWDHIAAQRMCLQRCSCCTAYRYPPGPCCPQCLSAESEWQPIKGTGVIASWTIFHRQFFDAYPAPHNCIAVLLAEGVHMVSTLDGPQPEGDWIGHAVRLHYRTFEDSSVLPVFRLAIEGDAQWPPHA